MALNPATRTTARPPLAIQLVLQVRQTARIPPAEDVAERPAGLEPEVPIEFQPITSVG